ncbi:MAG TPA: sensor histidine kinase N-terminal domain-containing protein [Burkholderiaceae bacterium]
MRLPWLRGQWLTRELLQQLMLPLLAIVAATAAVGTYGAHILNERVFDRWLLDAARSAAALITFDQGLAVVDMSPQVETVLLYDDVDRTWFSIAQGDRHLAGRPNLPTSGTGEQPYRLGTAYDAVVDGMPVRMVRIRVTGSGEPVIVLVAETRVKRQRAEQDLLMMLIPMGALVVTAGVLVFFAVRRTVQPLEAIAVRWNARAEASLEPIDEASVPRELLPFARALNGLLARVRAMLARERQFAATAAHQIRTPLTGLQLGLARAREAPDLQATRAVIDELSQSTQRVARLVQQLLAFSRLDPEVRHDVGFALLDIVALAEEVGATHAEQALARGIDLELASPGAPIVAQAHRELLSEALTNLIDNAIAYTPRGGHVLVDFVAQPPSVRVNDSGPGIPATERAMVFERFVRGPRAEGTGSGLGMAIVREIAALHGATVRLGESASGGLRVEIVFPPSEAAVHQAGRRCRPSGSNIDAGRLPAGR